MSAFASCRSGSARQSKTRSCKHAGRCSGSGSAKQASNSKALQSVQLRHLSAQEALNALAKAADPQGEAERGAMWKCDVCSFVVEASDRKSLASPRWWHIRSQHPDEPPESFAHLQPRGPQVSPDFGGKPGEWTCGFCLQGLPPMPRRTWRAPALRHLKQCHGATLAASNLALCKRQSCFTTKGSRASSSALAAGVKGTFVHSKLLKQAEALDHKIVKVLPDTGLKRGGRQKTAHCPLTRHIQWTCRACAACWNTARLRKQCEANVRCLGRKGRATLLRSGGRVRLWTSISKADKALFTSLWRLSSTELKGLEDRVKEHCKTKKKRQAVAAVQAFSSDAKPGAALKKRRARRTEEASPATWTRSLLDDGDIESQPGPSSQLRVCTLNVAGAATAFEALHSLVQAGVDVLGLQETRLSPRQAVAWQREAARLGFRAWVHPGYLVVDALGRRYHHHGLAVAVKDTLHASEVFRHDDDLGQCLVVTVAGRELCFLWQKPDTAEEGGLLEALSPILDLHPQCIFIGDWNAPPDGNPFFQFHHQEVHAVVDPAATYAPTRRDGNRAIDYAVTAPGCRSRVWFAEEFFSDYFAVHFDFRWPLHSADEATFLVPTRKYGPVGDLTEAQWRQEVARSYSRLEADNFDPAALTRHQVERQWHSFNSNLEQAFLQAHTRMEGPAFFGLFRGKGSPPHVVSASELGKQLRGGKIWPRRLRRLLGRILHRNHIWHGHQARLLDRRIQAAWPADIPWEWDWQQQAAIVQEALDQAHRDEHRDRIAAWKQRMARGGPRAHSWVKSSAEITPQSLHLEGPPSSSPAEALGMIDRHWRGVWDRRRPLDQDIVDEWLLTGAQQRGRPLGWTPLTAQELHRNIVQSNASSAGPSGWDVAELKAVPLQAWRDFVVLVNAWFQAGIFPQQWQHMSMVIIPKPGKQPRVDGAMAVDNLRPISVGCTIWRLVASSICKRDDTRDWVQHWTLPCFHGAVQQRDALTGLAALDQQVNAHRHALAAMDLSKAFDFISPQAVISILQRLGLPAQVACALKFIWGSQRRWLRWQQWTSPAPATVGSSVPQGDAFSPRSMLALMLAPALAVAAAHVSVQQTLFLDDRVLTSSTGPALLDAVCEWEGWSEKLGLSENRRKLAVLPRTAAQERDIIARGWRAAISENVRVLGVDFCRRRASRLRPTCFSRLEVAISRAQIIASLPVSCLARTRLYRILVVPKAVWGWIFKKPTKRDLARLQRPLRRLAGHQSLGSADLFRLLEGHSMDASFGADYFACNHFHRAMALGCFFEWPQCIGSGTWLSRVRKTLKDTGWSETAPFSWHHDALGAMVWQVGDGLATRRRPGDASCL